MKIKEVVQSEMDAASAQLQSISQQEHVLKMRKARIKANKALKNLQTIQAKR